MAGQHPDHPNGNGGWNTPRVRRALGMGLGTGVASAFRFWKIPRKPLMLVSGGLAGTTAAVGVALAVDRGRREAQVQGDPVPDTTPVKRLVGPLVTGALAGSVMAGSMWLTSVTDEWSEKGLARLGARHPRATYAVLAGIGTALLEYFDEDLRERAEATAEKA